MIKKCYGCGQALQTKYPNKLGFTPKIEANYCQRCFRITHYNDAKIVPEPKEISKIIDIVNKEKKNVIFIIDFLNINNETLETFKQINEPKILVISKLDLIPLSIKQNKIKNYLINYYKINAPIFFVSSLKQLKISELTNYLINNEIKTSYVLGFVNVGKSSLINAIYEKLQNSKPMITTSVIPNTTLDFINLKINDQLTLIDSPGFVMKNSILNDLDFIKKANPNKYLKPTTFQLKNNSGIIIEDLITIFNLDEKNSFTFYMSNLVNLRKIFNKNKDGIKIKIAENSDLIIKGLGFINIKKACNVYVRGCEKDLIDVRPSIF